MVVLAGFVDGSDPEGDVRYAGTLCQVAMPIMSYGRLSSGASMAGGGEALSAAMPSVRLG